MTPFRFLLISTCCAALAGCASVSNRPLGGPSAAPLPPAPLAPPPVAPSSTSISVAPMQLGAAAPAPRELYNLDPEKKTASSKRTVAAKPAPKTRLSDESSEDLKPARKVAAAPKPSASKPAPKPEADEPEVRDEPAPVAEAPLNEQPSADLPAPAPASEPEAENLDEAPLAIPVPKGGNSE